MAKSKFFRVAVEGATTDGRVIERSWIADIAETYNATVYGARIFMEHLRGIFPDGPFKAYGDVAAVKAEAIADGELKGKLALYAQIEPTPELVAMTKARQKIYSSIEVNPKFADTGRAYLVGMGVTDSPASLGTDMLAFAAHAEVNPLSARKQDPANLFTVAEPVEIEWEDEPADTGAAAVFASIRAKLAKLTGKSKNADGEFAEIRDTLSGIADALEHVAERDTAVTQAFADQVAALTTRLDAAEAAAAKSTADLAAFRAEIESAPNHAARPAATGGNGLAQTNC